MKSIKENWSTWVFLFTCSFAVIIVYKLLDNWTNVGQFLGNFIKVIAPFLSGILLAYILYMPVSKVEESYSKSKLKIISKHSRKFSIFTVYLIVLLLVVILINFILPVVVNSIVELTNNFQNYYKLAIESYGQLPEDSFFKSQVVTDIVNGMQNFDLKQYININKIMDYAKGVMGIASSVFQIFVTIIVSIYILLERTEIVSFLKRAGAAIFNKDTYDNLGRYFYNTNQIFFKFLASQFLDAVVVGILTTVVMSIMGIKYAPLLGFMIGLFNMIPYFGAIIAIVIATLITAITGGITQALWMVVVVTIVQQIDANIINPKIVGDSLKISPLLVIIAVTIGGEYFGVLGMFLGVPVIAVLKVFINDYIEDKNKKRIEEMFEN